jgi:hypothetical protein
MIRGNAGIPVWSGIRTSALQRIEDRGPVVAERRLWKGKFDIEVAIGFFARMQASATCAHDHSLSHCQESLKLDVLSQRLGVCALQSRHLIPQVTELLTSALALPLGVETVDIPLPLSPLLRRREHELLDAPLLPDPKME